MTDLTSDLSTTGMPFLNFQMYALHVLFPGLDDHPVLHQNKVKNFTQWTYLVHWNVQSIVHQIIWFYQLG